MNRRVMLTCNGNGIRVDATALPGVLYTVQVVGTSQMDVGFNDTVNPKFTLTASNVHTIEGVDLANLYINGGAAGQFVWVFISG
jgi:hypothetical protein